MQSWECRLTVDDLIVKYMIEKVRLGYKPSYTVEEFMLFLNYFRKHKEVYDVINDGDRLFDRFFDRMGKHWSTHVSSSGVYDERVFVPHIERCDNGLLVATNRLSNYDNSILNIYFMVKWEQKEIDKIICEFLKTLPKRKIDMSTSLEPDKIEIGQNVAALFVESIWREYIKINVSASKWPCQCNDIYDYLLENDFSTMLKLPPMREEMLSFYSDVSKKIGVLLQNDSKLRFNNCGNPFLPYANYRLIMDGYFKLIDNCRNCSFDVIVEDNVFIENADCSYKYSQSTIVQLDNPRTKRLVRELNNKINNQ